MTIVFTEAEGCTFAPPGGHRQWQHELHGSHDGDDVVTSGARGPPPHALAPPPAHAGASPCLPTTWPPPPQPCPRAGRTPSAPGSQPPSQLPQPPTPPRPPAPDLTAWCHALLTGKAPPLLIGRVPPALTTIPHVTHTSGQAGGQSFSCQYIFYI